MWLVYENNWSRPAQYMQKNHFILYLDWFGQQQKEKYNVNAITFPAVREKCTAIYSIFTVEKGVQICPN